MNIPGWEKLQAVIGESCREAYQEGWKEGFSHAVSVVLRTLPAVAGHVDGVGALVRESAAAMAVPAGGGEGVVAVPAGGGAEVVAVPAGGGAEAVAVPAGGGAEVVAGPLSGAGPGAKKGVSGTRETRRRGRPRAAAEQQQPAKVAAVEQQKPARGRAPVRSSAPALSLAVIEARPGLGASGILAAIHEGGRNGHVNDRAVRTALNRLQNRNRIHNIDRKWFPGERPGRDRELSPESPAVPVAGSPQPAARVAGVPQPAAQAGEVMPPREEQQMPRTGPVPGGGVRGNTRVGAAMPGGVPGGAPAAAPPRFPFPGQAPPPPGRVRGFSSPPGGDSGGLQPGIFQTPPPTGRRGVRRSPAASSSHPPWASSPGVKQRPILSLGGTRREEGYGDRSPDARRVPPHPFSPPPFGDDEGQ